MLHYHTEIPLKFHCMRHLHVNATSWTFKWFHDSVGSESGGSTVNEREPAKEDVADTEQTKPKTILKKVS